MLIFDIALDCICLKFCAVSVQCCCELLYMSKSVYLCLCKNLLTRVFYFPRAANISSADRGVPVSCVISVSLYFPVAQLQEVWSLLFLPSQCLSIFHSLGSVFLSLLLAFCHSKISWLSALSCVSLDLAFLRCQGHAVSPTLTFPKLTF